MTSYENLSLQHKRFVDSYVDCLNYRKAYQDAYPLSSVDAAYTNGSRLATNPNVRKAIFEKLKLYPRDKTETLQKIFLLLDFDLTEYLADDLTVDVDKLNASGLGWMIKGIKQLKYGSEIVLMDKDRALENLAKIQGLFEDKQQVTINITQEVSAAAQLNRKLQDLDSRLKVNCNS